MDSPRRLGVAVVTLAVSAGCAAHGAAGKPIPHFYRVTHELYRGGQPTDEGLRRLKELGVKTVVDLREEDPALIAHEQRLVESLGMHWVHLPMRSSLRPSQSQVDTFLKLMNNRYNQPVFIHCREGEDRTGALVALYRVAQQGWVPKAAYSEARSLGLGWNPMMRRVILHQSGPSAVRVAGSN